MSDSRKTDNIDVDRKTIMETFIRCIAHVSDPEYQQRVWTEGRGPECDDFDEFVNYFFLEGEDILSNYKDFGITDIQYHLLIKFRDEVDVFSHKDYHPKKFLTNPKWKKIMEMAKEILKAFNYQKK